MFVPSALGESPTATVKPSGPIDLAAPYGCESLPYKTVLVTGGASGAAATVVAALAWNWVRHGCQVVIGHEDEDAGCALVCDIRAAVGNAECCTYCHCDLTDEDSQVAMFSFAEDYMGTCGIDAVVIGPSVLDSKAIILPDDHDDDKAASLDLHDRELLGLVTTAHLALAWLSRNGDAERPPRPDGRAHRPRDRHILLLGSLPGLHARTGRPLRTAAEPALKALFRSLSGGAGAGRGVRTTMLAPYLDRPSPCGSGAAERPEPPRTDVADVAEAATRLMADESIVARGLMVGPAPAPALWDFDAGAYERVEALVYARVAASRTVEQTRVLAQGVAALLLAPGR
ncbi:hypothetical protein P8C59_009462 [Phyllachora maydis]|uniref:Uncharacterized protein n=1 Tax=Phyllachora maydis TaxID=1825666 RepID=A0AAD9IDA8_9PEZI|nr:hypothetical protein P8C59_009462 [Phyllachora maydis]